MSIDHSNNQRFPGLAMDCMMRFYMNGVLVTDKMVLERFKLDSIIDVLMYKDEIPLHRVTMPPVSQPPPPGTALDLVPHTTAKPSIGEATYGDERGILLAAHDRLNRMEEAVGIDGGSLQINHDSPETRMDRIERVLEDRSLRALNLIAKIGNKVIQGTGTDMVVADSKAFYGQMLTLAQESISEQGNWQEGYEQGYADALKENAPSTMSLKERASAAWNMLRGRDGNAEKVEA